MAIQPTYSQFTSPILVFPFSPSAFPGLLRAPGSGRIAMAIGHYIEKAANRGDYHQDCTKRDGH